MLDDAPASQIGVLLNIPVGQIDRNPKQPRHRVDQEALVGLASSLEDSGVIEPLIVRPRNGRYQLVAGERRWLAAKQIGRATVPAVVRELDDETTHELAVIENMARQDLTPIDEARAVATLCDTRGLSKAEIGRRVGRSREAISNLVRLLDLPDDAQALIDTGKLSEGHGHALLICKDHDVQRRLARHAAAEEWSVKKLKQAAHDANDPRALPRRPIHADQAAQAVAFEQRFSSVLCHDVRVEPRKAGMLRVSLDLTPREAELVLGRLGAPAAEIGILDGVIAVDGDADVGPVAPAFT